MSAEEIFNCVMNDKNLYDTFVFNLKQLRTLVDRAATKCARANADWHDDPDCDDYEEHHAPASEQYPPALREEALKDLIEYWLAEFKKS